MSFVIHVYPKVKLAVYYLFFSSTFYPQTGAVVFVIHTYPKLKLAVYYLLFIFFAFDPKT